LRVIFDVHTSLDTASGLVEELHNRFVSAGLATETQEDVRLVIQSPRIGVQDGIGNTSAGRAGVFSGANRQPFRVETFPDLDINTGRATGSRNVLAVNPDGTLSYGNRPYNLPSETIVTVLLTDDESLPLTPDLLKSGDIYPIRLWE
jgi:hypothetical protein